VLLNLRRTAALRGPNWKVIVPGRGGPPVYYDLARDPEEQQPRSAQRFAPGALRALKRRMAVEQSRAKSLPWDGGGAAELEPELQEKLKKLGYVE